MKKTVKILLGILAVIVILLLVSWQSSANPDLKVYFFDVGQGDGILIRTPSQQNIIIDGGPDNAFISKLGQALPFYDRTIDLMVLTHPHDDHLVGLIEVLKRYQVKEVLSSGVLHNTDAYLEWLKIIKDKAIPLKIALAGQEFIFGQARLKVIYPFKSYVGQAIVEKAGEAGAGGNLENLNNTSVVTQLIYGEVKIIFTGDLEAFGEAQLVESFKNNQPALASQLIKVGHHGSADSSSTPFLQAVSPLYSIISVGRDNKFNHPSLRTLKRLTSLGVKIYRTDQTGNILFKSNGQNLNFSP